MAENEQFQPNNSGGPGRPTKVRLQISTRHLNDLIDRTMQIGLSSPDDLTAVMAMEVIAKLITSDKETVKVIPCF